MQSNVPASVEQANLPDFVATSPELGRVLSKVTRRILPILFVAYVLCTMDRLNIGYAHLRMKEDLNLSDAAYGLGAGLFFITYMLFEIPSSLLLARIGARVTILRIMVGWGLVSAATLFVRTPGQFYAVRLLLGICEAGFFPAAIYYFSLWLPYSHRGRTIATFMMATVIAGIVGGPLSGFIMDYMDSWGGLHGWQWVFLIEGIPSCVVGVIAYFVLSETPAQASWLSHAERSKLLNAMAAEKQPHNARDHASFAHVMRDPRMYLFALVFFLVTATAYGLLFWSPSLIQSLGVKSFTAIGVDLAIPSSLAAVVAILNARHSDKKLERRWHFAVPALVCGTALCVLAFVPMPFMASMVCLSAAFVGVTAAAPIFWTVPSSYLRPSVAAAGIALVNCIAVLSGMVTPYLLGLIKEHTGKLNMGLAILGVSIVLAAITMLCVAPRQGG